MATDVIGAAPSSIGSPIQAAAGAFVASANAASLVVGFNPLEVEVFNETQNVLYTKTRVMAPNATRKIVASGARTLDTTSLVTFPADAGLNEPGSSVLIAAAAFANGDKISWIVKG
jgi:hypothetical protein